jgi:hypothetical protein
VTAAPHVDEWRGDDVTVADVERRLASLRALPDPTGDGVPDLRTSVMTHMAWVPQEWEGAALDTLEGLAERHPSRTLLLLPQPESRGGLDAGVSVRCFALPGQEHHVCSEVVRLRLRGDRARAPASIVMPLLIPDLPVFLRWRGRPDFAGEELAQMLGVVDRLIVDSGEWADVPAAYVELRAIFDRVAVSDIAWARTLPWRARIAELWPVAPRTLRVRGPEADAHLLAGWLRSRLRREIRLEHEPREELDGVAFDDDPVPAPTGRRPTPSDLLSDQLETFSRDRVFEAAAAAA